MLAMLSVPLSQANSLHLESESISDSALQSNTMISGIADASDIRLAGGRNPFSGRLEVMLGGTWGTVCERRFGFTKTEADVACEQLLGPDGQSALHGDYILFM